MGKFWKFFFWKRIIFFRTLNEIFPAFYWSFFWCGCQNCILCVPRTNWGKVVFLFSSKKKFSHHFRTVSKEVSAFSRKNSGGFVKTILRVHGNILTNIVFFLIQIFCWNNFLKNKVLISSGHSAVNFRPSVQKCFGWVIKAASYVLIGHFEWK